jgi:hypothetical protein
MAVLLVWESTDGQKHMTNMKMRTTAGKIMHFKLYQPRQEVNPSLSESQASFS